MVWELLQMHRITAARNGADAAGGTARESMGRARRAEGRVHELEDRCELLLLAVSALAELLHEQGGMRTDDLEARMREIDLRDGERDGRITPTSKRCHDCRRENAPRRDACLYCGGDLPRDASPLAA